MIIFFDKHVQERLERIEEVEGIPQDEFVRQAVSAWAYTHPEQRQALALQIMSAVVRKGVPHE